MSASIPVLFTLKDKVEHFFEEAFSICASEVDLLGLGDDIVKRKMLIYQPMRVAFVGRVSAGKSTMMNAFLGSELAPTGNRDLTKNVCVFRYGEKKKLLVHRCDGSTSEDAFDSLESLAGHYEGQNELLDKIRYLEVFYPNPLLKIFQLIDTPGLHSFFENDSKNTKDLLQSTDMRPHAVVFLYHGAIMEADVQEIERFHGLSGGMLSGVTAIGVRTKCDMDGNMTLSRRIIQNDWEKHARLHQCFYTIMPAAAQLSYAAQTITEAEKQALVKLATLPDAVLKKLLMASDMFCHKEISGSSEVPSTSEREKLLLRLGFSGVKMSLDNLKAGKPIEQLIPLLLEESQVEKVRTLVVQHFGNRAYLLKVLAALAYISNQAKKLAMKLAPDKARKANKIAAMVEEILINEQRFNELELLGRYYNKTIGLSDKEKESVLRITGEYGTSCANRLGLTDNTSIEEMLITAKQQLKYWQEILNTPDITVNSVLRDDIANPLVTSYGKIVERLESARLHITRASILLSGDDQLIELRPKI